MQQPKLNSRAKYMAEYREAMADNGFRQHNWYIHDKDVECLTHIANKTRSERYMHMINEVSPLTEIFNSTKDGAFCYMLANRRAGPGPDYNDALDMKKNLPRYKKRAEKWLEAFDEYYVAKGMFVDYTLSEPQQAVAGAKAYALGFWLTAERWLLENME